MQIVISIDVNSSQALPLHKIRFIHTEEERGGGGYNKFPPFKKGGGDETFYLVLRGEGCKKFRTHIVPIS